MGVSWTDVVDTKTKVIRAWTKGENIDTLTKALQSQYKQKKKPPSKSETAKQNSNICKYANIMKGKLLEFTQNHNLHIFFLLQILQVSPTTNELQQKGKLNDTVHLQWLSLEVVDEQESLLKVALPTLCILFTILFSFLVTSGGCSLFAKIDNDNARLERVEIVYESWILKDMM